LIFDYGVTPPYSGSLTGTASTTVNRIVATIDANGNINTTPALTDFLTGNNPRTATSSDGTNIWLGGAAGGVRYTTIGSTTSTQLATVPTNIIQVNIFNCRLYETSATITGMVYTIAAVGSRLPTTTGQTITPLSELLNVSYESPYGFYMANLSAGNVLYVTNNADSTIIKYSLVSGSWVANDSLKISTSNIYLLTT